MTDTADMTISEKIEYYSKQFVTQPRGDATITVFKKETDELHNSVMSAHGDKLPNDWIFDKYHSVLLTMKDYTIDSDRELEDNRNEIVDGLVDIYTSDLIDWLKGNTEYTDQVINEGEEYQITDTGSLLMKAQYLAIDEIYSEVVRLLTE